MTRSSMDKALAGADETLATIQRCQKKAAHMAYSVTIVSGPLGQPVAESAGLTKAELLDVLSQVIEAARDAEEVS